MPNPPVHPYLILWQSCRYYGQRVPRQDGSYTIVPALPFSGGYADQPAEVMLVFEILEGLLPELEKAQEQREKARGLYAGPPVA